MCDQFKGKNFQLAEIVAPVTTTGNLQFNFGNQPQLQSFKEGQGPRVYIKAIEIFSDKAIALSPITAGAPVAPADAIRNAVLTITEQSSQLKMQIPLVILNRITADTGADFVPGVQDLFQFKDLWQVDWSKSYITILAAQGTSYSYLFGVHYDYLPD